MPLRFTPFHRLDGRPNVVVDGSPTVGTVLTLTHWPGHPPPAGLGRDTSAQMAFAYLDAGAPLHGAAAEVSNNHFDQDGLVGRLGLTCPEVAVGRRALLEAVAAAGDFAVWTDRRAARLATAIAAWADPDHDAADSEAADHEAADSERPAGDAPGLGAAGGALPDEYAERTGRLYAELLGRLPEWCDDPDRARPLWEQDDAELDAALALLEDGAVVLRERPEIDLAVLELPESGPGAGLRGGRRFAHQRVAGLHPMAVTAATDCNAVLTRQGRRWHLRYRYESWVTYRSRRPRPRRDLCALAAQLAEVDPAGGVWVADQSGDLEPVLATVDGTESGLDAAVVEGLVANHLASAPADWDPYRAERGLQL